MSSALASRGNTPIMRPPPLEPGTRALDAPDLIARDSLVWRLESSDGVEGILKRHEPTVVDPTSALVASDFAWLHRFLDHLASTGFPAPRPLPLFVGESIVIHGGALWECVSFVPGEVIGWANDATLETVGELLGSYHSAVSSFGPLPQRPIAFPVAELVELLGHSAGEKAPSWVGDLCEELSARLATTSAGERLVIHGDFTAHNVVSARSALSSIGVIDFDLAHVELPMADLAYGLWRSGRPFQQATWLEDERVAAMVRGYARVRRLAPEAAGLIPMLMWGRGVQIALKGALRGRRPRSDVPGEVFWLRANEQRLTEVVLNATQYVDH